MSERIVIGDIEAEVLFKAISNIHLGVYPPDGHVRISAPSGVALETVRLFAIAKLGWIRTQQRRMRSQDRETAREYIDRESHYVWGRRYMLQIREVDAAPSVSLAGNKLILAARPGSDANKLAEILDAWYRDELREAAVPLIEIWEARIGVKIERLFVQHMKTMWGSCNPNRAHIRLNTELAKKPRECLEYILVHELVHLLAPRHDDRFISFMNNLLPQWKDRRGMLNGLPIRHEAWEY